MAASKIPLQGVIGVICDCLSDLTAEDQRRAIEGVCVSLGLEPLNGKTAASVPDPVEAYVEPPQWDAPRTRWIEERVAQARAQVQQAINAPNASASPANTGYRVRRWYEHV